MERSLKIERSLKVERAWATTGVVATTGLIAEVLDWVTALPPSIAETLSLSYEANVPTWYASSLLLACAFACGRAAPVTRTPTRWRVLSGVFAFMSLDEAIEIHEHLGGLFEGSGVLFFSWVIPASILVLAIGLAMLPLVSALRGRWRTLVVLAGAIYVGGALLMELPLGWWTERHGDDNLVYGLLDWVEETLELLGATLFLITTWRLAESGEHDDEVVA